MQKRRAIASECSCGIARQMLPRRYLGLNLLYIFTGFENQRSSLKSYASQELKIALFVCVCV
jgi:hypothetical protein